VNESITIFDVLAIAVFAIGVILQGLNGVALLIAWAAPKGHPEAEGGFAHGVGWACVLIGIANVVVALPLGEPLVALGLGGASIGWGTLGLLNRRVLAPRGTVGPELLRAALIWTCLVAGLGIYMAFALESVDRPLLAALGGPWRVGLSLAFALGLALVAWRLTVARRDDDASA
jgi:hypothetical protein